MVCKMEHTLSLSTFWFYSIFLIFQFECKHDTLARYGRRFRYWLKTSPSIKKRQNQGLIQMIVSEFVTIVLC